MAMTNEKQYIESLEEMVFKNRNKEYGSYQLRRKYKKYVLISLALGLFLLGAVIAYPLIKSFLAKETFGKKTQVEVSVDLKKMENAPPPPPPPPPAEKIVEQVKFVAPKVTTDTTQVTKDFGKQSVLVETGGPPPTIEPVKVEPVVEVKQAPEEVFTIVEEMPAFPDGDVASYLAKNIKYPVVAQENGIQGRVICQFVVNKDGSIVDVQVVRGVDQSLDKEAVRVIQSMPRWTPGKQRNQPVRVKYTLPVNFKLQ
ncbi:MAG: TonB-dependent receptor [Bacteroidetes bacterium]|nr:TonB-dependent receptor [Bacteroidota bacterium]